MVTVSVTVSPGCYLDVLRLHHVQLLLHITDVARGLRHLGSLQVSLRQQLLDVLLLLLQSLLQRRGARDLTGVASRCLRQLQRYSEKHSHLTFWMLSDAVFTYRYTRCEDCVRGNVSEPQSKLQIKKQDKVEKSHLMLETQNSNPPQEMTQILKS